MAISNVLPLTAETKSKVAAKPRAKAMQSARPSLADASARPAPALRDRLALLSGACIGGVAVAATALSLSDLADSIQEVAHVPMWKAYSLATALDANFIATESFSLFAAAAVVKATHRATTCTKIITLTMSAVANSYAMANGAEGYVMQGACIVAGCAIPVLVALATYTIGRALRT